MKVQENPNLDPHLLLRLIDQIEKSGQLTNELKILRVTTLASTRRFQELQTCVDNIKELHYPTLKQKLAQAEKQTVEQLEELGGDELLTQLQDIPDKQDDYPKETEELFSNAYKVARIRYEQGKFEQAKDLLTELDYFVEDDPLWLPISWGKLGCEILLERYDKARDAVKRLKYKIDDYRFATVQRALAQKQAFLNTCCFVFFETGREEDLETFINICSEQEYFSTIQMACPYILRYLTVAMLMNKTYQKYGNFDLYRLVDSINRNLFNYSDSAINFLRQLLIKFDFQAAVNEIKVMTEELSKDQFVGKLVPKIIECSQFLFYETYCKIHQNLKVEDVAKFTGKSLDEAELWIVGLIRRAGINVKVDSVSGVIRIVRNLGRNLNEQKYAELIPRTLTIVNNLSRILQS